ncbi:MAG: cyclase family protein [Pseudobdellovibrionaceae bacterium]
MKIHDISPLISEKIGVFPGDHGFQRKVALETNQGNHITLSSISTTLHLGAHADAPIHYGPGLETIEQLKLEPYVGLVQVVTAQVKRGERVTLKHLAAAITAPRVLVRTNSFLNPDHWNSDFSSFAPELLETFAQQGVVLVGIDTPSVDPEDSKTLEAHQALRRNQLRVLEGLVLDQVKDGLYFLVALPLKIKDADAAPVRAVLLEDPRLLSISSFS